MKTYESIKIMVIKFNVTEIVTNSFGNDDENLPEVTINPFDVEEE